jgi:hypothetical protein
MTTQNQIRNTGGTSQERRPQWPTGITTVTGTTPPKASTARATVGSGSQPDSGGPRVAYFPRKDATPEGELAAVYRPFQMTRRQASTAIPRSTTPARERGTGLASPLLIDRCLQSVHARHAIVLGAASTPFQHLVIRTSRSKERWHERDPRQGDRCWTQRQEYPSSRPKSGSAEGRVDPERAGRASRRGPRERAPVGNLEERRLPTDVTKISHGARSGASSASARSPLGVSGAAVLLRCGPRTNPHSRHANRLRRRSSFDTL